MGMRYECNPMNCEGLVSTSFLEDNNVEIIGSHCSPRLLKVKMDNEPNFIPHLMAVEKRCERKKSWD